MKYTLTGSLGNITRPVAEQLVKAGHQVSVISSKASNTDAIKKIGATPLIGNIEDPGFLTEAFKGADAVYLMTPPRFDVPDVFSNQKHVADNYAKAVGANQIKAVVVLSSIGAHMGTGAGPVDGLAYLEARMRELPDTKALYLRPSYFYQNILAMIPLLKNAGIMGGNQPGDFRMLLTHPVDIAAVVAEQLSQLSFFANQVIYIASDERSWQEITNTLTKAVGKENIPWVEFTDEQYLQGMLQAGVPATNAEGYKQMGIALRTGEMQADFKKQNPGFSGKIKLEDFAKEFAAVFNS
ncbi:NAD(P)H-binding protein [Terrimonas pollutisoli]|uniref:NAD(P)H-binding protein n=1 Tax=Terrimonas pollutisoli TaxID=3034147 RepID=UPI0023EBBFB3|nr:NAD(P)H-binding protein [Terrimonas sp. H1YJ31]